MFVAWQISTISLLASLIVQIPFSQTPFWLLLFSQIVHDLRAHTIQGLFQSNPFNSFLIVSVRCVPCPSFFKRNVTAVVYNTPTVRISTFRCIPFNRIELRWLSRMLWLRSGGHCCAVVQTTENVLWRLFVPSVRKPKRAPQLTQCTRVLRQMCKGVFWICLA